MSEEGKGTKRLLIILVVAASAAAASEPAISQPEIPYVPGEILVKFRKAAADDLGEQLKKGKSPKELRLSNRLDKLNRKYRATRVKPVFKSFRVNRRRMDDLRSGRVSALNAKQRHLLRRLNRAPKDAKVPELDRIYKIDFDLDEDSSILPVLNAYQADPDVEYAELNYIVSIDAEPNDPLYPILWSLDNRGQAYPFAGSTVPARTLDSDIDAPQAWDKTVGSADVVVAVLDTGVNYTHRDLTDNMWTNEAEANGVKGYDDDGNGYIDDIYGYNFFASEADPNDDHGHGTHCSGTIAARGNNGLDITGVSWHARIMALKFLDSSGRGNMDSASQAIYYAANNGADITSNSWSAGEHSQTLKDAIDYAHSQGVTIVASAGNNNSTEPRYPAYYDHVISVAATDSNDDRAWFSNYGSWVDIAAPGVNVLSLRAHGTTRGAPYDQYTTVLSGTSMSCPHVAGACAVLLAIDPDVRTDQLNDVLAVTADPIAPGICASGRMNLFAAVLRVFGPTGNIWLDRPVYSCSDVVRIKLFDTDLSGRGSQIINLSVDNGDVETIVLDESDDVDGIFAGTILTESGRLDADDNLLQVADSAYITAAYTDLDDGTGITALATDTAQVDCVPPQVFNVSVDVPRPDPIVSFQTNEPTFARVVYWRALDRSEGHVDADVIMDVNHSIVLTEILPGTDYFFMVEVTDALGYESVDDNSGSNYAFRSTGPSYMYVPGDYPTIQEAIERAWDGSTVWIADGLYTGPGNRDVDFHGRAIVLRSEKGSDNCIIDCQGDENESHRGFYFVRGETNRSVLQGVTIINGFGLRGGAIYCSGTSPTIRDCVIRGNSASDSGGGIYGCAGKIEQCTITGNTGLGRGGGLYGCHGIISDCVVSGNVGGGLNFCNGLVENCTIVGNSGAAGGGLGNCGGSIINCIVWNNRPEGTSYHENSVPLYSCLQQPNTGTGCISTDPCFITPGYWDSNDTPDSLEDDSWVEGDYHLLPDSPCIGTGRYDYRMDLPCKDCDGLMRMVGPEIDMGAFEQAAPTDTDGDWLPDNLEVASGSDPCLPDTDGDGLVDGIEILGGTRLLAAEGLRSWSIAEGGGSVQHALFLSRPGEVLSISPGTYAENLFMGGRDVVLTSMDPNEPNVVAATIISGDTDSNVETTNGRVVAFAGTEGPDCMILGLTIADGNDRTGGGLRGNRARASVINCIITRNTASSQGGGVSEFDGTINGSTIGPANKALFGSAAALCRATIRDSIIRDNDGGAFASCASEVSNCIITGNESKLYSSVIMLSSGKFEDCLIVGNTSAYGGAMFWYVGTMNGCTIAGNRTADNGPILVEPTGLISNSIIWDNYPKGIRLPAIFSPEPAYSCIQDYTGSTPGNIAADPCFVKPGYWANGADPGSSADPADPQAVWMHGNYHLRENSPCIDTGDPNDQVDPNRTDMDGQTRIFADRIDMGADESVPPMEVPVKFSPRVLKLDSRGKWLNVHFFFRDLSLAEHIDVRIPAVIEPLGIASEQFDVLAEKDGHILAKASFRRDDFCTSSGGLPTDVAVTGYFTNGRAFLGRGRVTIAGKPFAQLALFASYWLNDDCRQPDWCGSFDSNKDRLVNFDDFVEIPLCSVEAEGG